MGILVYGIPILLGISCGFILSFPVNLALTAVATVIGGGLLWSTRDAELGSLIGVVAVIEAGIFIVALWSTIFAVGGLPFAIDMSWLFRSAQP